MSLPYSVRVSLFLLLPLVALLLGSSQAAGQDPTQDFNSGITPYQQYHGGDIDSVNTATGSLNLHIPLISFPQRGSDLRLTFAINYNSAVVKRPRIGFGAQAYYQWSLVDTNPVSVSVVDDQTFGLYTSVTCLPNPPCGSHGGQTRYFYYAAIGADGAQHMMGYTSGAPSGTSGPQILRSVDATGFLLTIPTAGNTTGYTLFDRNGTRYSGWANQNGILPIGKREDRNGNIISLTSGTYTDTMGRSIPLPPTPDSTANTDNTGCVGPLTVAKAVLWQVPGYNGTPYPIKFCYANITINIPDDGAGGQNGGPEAS